MSSVVDIPLQTTLSGHLLTLEPLQRIDFVPLYKVAADPLIWEQHPNKNRYQRNHFQTFFTGAMQSEGAFAIKLKDTKRIIGSSRFYQYDELKNKIHIGYTFLSRKYWGGPYNKEVKTLMLDYIFQFVEVVEFHIGINNIRSQISIARLGATKVGEVEVEYYGEELKPNFIFQIKKEDWLAQSS